MNGNKHCIFVLVFSVFFFQGLLQSALSQPRKIEVVYTDWFPYTYKTEGKAAGFEVEVLQAVMAKMNIEVTFVNYPWKRCLHALKAGKSDALVSMLKSTEREKYTWYASEHISVSKVALFIRKEKKIEYNGSLDSLEGYSVGVIMGFTYGQTFDNATHFRKDNAVNTDILIRKVLHGRSDLGAENQIVTSATAYKMGLKDAFVYLEPPLFKKKLYVGFSKAKKHKVLSQDFSYELKEFKQTEAYKKILDEYGLISAYISDD